MKIGMDIPQSTRMSQLRLLVMGLLFTLGASDALAGKEGKVSKELAPMPKPALEVGEKWYYIKDGEEEGVQTVTAKGDGTISAKDSDGCSWTQSYFAPATKWKGCDPYVDGTQKVEFRGGDIWPLKVGNKFSWKFKGRDVKGETWSGVRNCKVKKQVRIKTVSGEYDTYKVVCADPWNIRIWWLSLDLKNDVRWERQSKYRVNRVLEMTKIESP